MTAPIDATDRPVFPRSSFVAPKRPSACLVEDVQVFELPRLLLAPVPLQLSEHGRDGEDEACLGDGGQGGHDGVEGYVAGDRGKDTAVVLDQNNDNGSNASQ